MNEYAEILNNEVVRVLVLDDKWTEEQSLQFLSRVSNNQWVKTEQKVGVTFEYHPEHKLFVRAKPFNSWKLDVKRGIYLPPIPKPIAIPVGYIVKWSEDLKEWVVDRSPF